MYHCKNVSFKIGYGSREIREFTEFSFHDRLKSGEWLDYVYKAVVNALRYAVEHEHEFSWGTKREGIHFGDLYERIME